MEGNKITRGGFAIFGSSAIERDAGFRARKEKWLFDANVPLRVL